MSCVGVYDVGRDRGSSMSLMGLGGRLQNMCTQNQQTSYECQLLTQTNRYSSDAPQCYAMIRSWIQTVL